MTLTLSRRTQRLIEKKVRDGQYDCPEDVVSAAIGSLIAQEDFGEFRPGELDALLEEGERSIRKSGTLDGDAAFRHRKAGRSK
ncbi:MAG: hypothetical protein HZA51_08815 [Planctomycetes bacterium]|nr:hypothetical protein [Planctomycetota bacterium]